MSHAWRMCNKRKHELENDKPTRKSARLNHLQSGTFRSMSLERRKTAKHERHLEVSPVMTRSRKRRMGHYLSCPKPEVIVIPDDSGDSTDGNCVRNLTYSSSDSNARVLTRHSYDERVLGKEERNNDRVFKKEHLEMSAKVGKRSVSGRYKLRNNESETLNVSKERKIAKSKNLNKTQQDNGPASEEGIYASSCSVVLKNATNRKNHNLRKSPRVAATPGVTPDKSSLCEEKKVARKEQKAVLQVKQTLKEPTKTSSNNVILSDVINQKCYHLRRRKSPGTVESVGETSEIGQKKVNKKALKKKLNERRNEKIEKNSFVDVNNIKPRALTQFTCAPSNPSSMSENQEKATKKTKVKKKGTLARKKELRALLEKQDEGYEDDAFEGTPFRYRRRLSKCKLSPVVLDTSIRCMSTDSELKTPFSKTPVNRLRPAGPLSSGTSESDTMTPGLLNDVNQNYIDCYVNQLKKRKIHLGCNKMKSHTPLSEKPFRVIQSKSFDFLSSDTVKRSTIENESCEDDYYWSDVE